MKAERGGERLFYHALAALLFAAACAWLGAACFPRLVPAEPEAAVPAASAAPARFRGLLLRREERFEPGAFPDAAEGERLPAARTGTESGLLFIGCDGWEALGPADAAPLSPDRLDALLSGAPAEADPLAPRLVYGFDLSCAAFLEGGAAPRTGPCRLRLEKVSGEVSARVLSVCADGGRTAMLLRLTEAPDALYRLRFVEGEFAQG